MNKIDYKRIRNLSLRSKIKTYIKKIYKYINLENIDFKSLIYYYKLIKKNLSIAARKNIIKKNKSIKIFKNLNYNFKSLIFS